MANVKWDKLEVGDFFTTNFNMGEDAPLYQKIEIPNSAFHNAIHLNKGRLCNLYIGPETTFEKVEVTFSIKPTE